MIISQIFGYLSGIAILLSFVPYTKDIFLNKTKPERASWFIWSILGFISFFSLLSKGATYSLFLPGGQALGDIFIFLLSIKYGFGGFLKRDFIALIGAGVGLFLWYITKEALIALLVAISIDGIGVLLTVVKSYEQPKTETISAWILTFLGGLFGIFAVGNLNIILLIFPIYICIANLSIILAIKLGLQKQLNIKKLNSLT